MSDQELQQLENAKRIADDLAPQATELEGRQGGAQEAGRQPGQAGGRNQHGRGGLFRRMASAITQASPSVGQPAVQALHAQGAAHPVNVVLPAAFDSKNPSIFANMLGNALAPAELSSIAALAVTDPTAAREQLAGKFNDIAQAVGRAGDAVALSILRQAAQDPANATRYYFAAAQRLQQLARKGAGGNADAMPAPVATEGAEPLAAPLVHEPVMAAHVATITKPTTNHAPAVHVHDSPLAAAPAHTIGDDGDATPIVPVAPTHAGKANSVVLRNPAGAIAEFARTNLDIGANPGDMAPLQMPSGSGAGNDNTVGYAMPGIKASTVAMRKPRARKTARRQPKDFRGGYRNLAQGVGGRSRALAQRGVSTAQAVGQTADQSVSTTLATDAQHAARLSTAATTPTAGVARAKRKPSYVKESHSPVKLDATTVAGDIAGLSQHAMPAAPLATAIAVGNQLLTNPAPLTAAFNAAFTPDFAGGDLVAPSPMVAVSANPIVAAPPKETLAVNGGANAVQSQFDSDIAPTVGDQPATTDQANVNKGKIRSAAGNAKKKAQHTKAASRANSSQQAAHQQKRNAEGKQRAAAGKQAASTKQKQQELEAANTLKAAKDKLRQEANDHATMALAMLSMTAEQRDKLFQDTLAQAEKAANDRFTQQRDKSVQDLADNKLKLTQANAAAVKQIDTDCDAHKTATHNTMKQLANQLKNHPKTAAQTALDLGKKDVATYKTNHNANLKAITDTQTSELKRIAEQEKQIVGFWQGKADASADDPQKQENAKSQIEQAKAKATGDRTRANNRATTDTQQENDKFTKLSTERTASAQKAHDEILHDSKAYLAKIVVEEKTLIDAIEKERTDGKNTANERMAVDDAALTRMQKDEYATLEVQLKTELDDARLAAANAKKDSAGKSIADKEKAKRDIETARTNALAKIDAANSETLYLAQMEVDYAHSEINNSLKDLGSYTVKAVRDISSLQTKLEREVDDTTGRITARANSAIAAQDNIVKSVKADLAETKSSYHGGSAAKFHTNIDAEKAAVVNLRERDKEYFAALQAKREGKPPDWDKKKDKARQSIRDAVTISGGDPSKIQAALLDATNGDPKLIAEILGDPTVSKALLQMAATDNAVWRGPFGTFDNWSSALSGKAPSNPTVDAIMAMGQCKDRNEVKAKMLDQAFNGGLTGWGYDADLISKIYDSTPPGERDKLNEKFKAATGKSLEQQHASENQTSSFFASATGNGERSDSQKLLDAQWQGRDQGIAEAKRQAASGGVMGSATKFVQDHPVVAGLAVVASGGVLAGPALALGTGQLDGMGNNVSGYLAQNDKIRDEVEIKPEDSYETRMEKQRRQRELFGNIEKYLETEGTSTEKLDHNIASSQYNKAFGSSQRLDDALTAMRKGDFKGYSTNLGAYQQETAFGDHKKAGDEGKRAQAYGYGKEYRAFQADIYAARHGGGKSSDPEGDYVKYVKENVNAVDANYIINQTQDKADPKTDPDKAAKQIAARLVYAQFGGMTGFGNDTDAMSEEFKNLPKEVKDKIAAEYAKQCLELGLTAGNQTAGNYFWGNTSTGNLESDMNLSYNGVSGVLMQGARKGIAAVTGSDNVGLVSPLLASETAGQSNEYLMATRDLSLGRAETPAEQLARAKYSNDLAKSGMLGSVGFGDAGGETERALAKQQEAYDRLSKLGLADKKIEELDPDSLTPEQASALKAFQDANESAEGWQKVAVTQQKSATEFVIDGVVTVVTVAAAVAAEVFTLGAATPIIITAVAGVMGVMAKSAALGGKFSGVEIDRGLVSAAVQAVSAGLAAGKGLEQLSEQLVKNAGQKIARAIVKEVLEAAINAGANITQTLLDPATYAGSPEEIRARLLGAIKSAAIQTGVSAVARGAIKGKLDLPENMSFGQKMLNDQLGYGGALDTALQYDFTSNNPREEVQKVLSAAIQTGIQTAATHVATGMYAKYQAGKVPGKGGVGSNGEIVVPAAEKTAVVDAIIKEGGTVTEVPRPKDSDSPATVLMVTTKDGHHVPLVVPNEHVVNHEKLPTEKPVDHNTEKIVATSEQKTSSNEDVTKTTVGNENGNADTGKSQNNEVIPPAILAQQHGVGHGQVDLHSHWMGNVSPEAMLIELQRSGGSKRSDVSSWEPLLRELNRLSSNAELTHQRDADGKIKSKDVNGEKDGGRGKSGDALEIVAEALRDIDKLKKKLDRDAPPDVQERRRQDIDALAKKAVEAALRSSSETDFNSAYEVRDELVKNFYGKAERASVMGDSQSIVAKQSELMTHFEGRPVVQERIERAAANEPRLEALAKRNNLSESEKTELKQLRAAKALVLEQFAYDRYSLDTIVRLAQDNIKYTEQSNSAKKLIERFDPEQMAFIKEIAKREHPELAANIDALVVKHLAMITSNNFGDRDQGVRQDDIPGKNRSMTSDKDFKNAHDQVVALANRSDIAGMDVAGAEHFAFNEQGQKRFEQLFISLAALAEARKKPIVFRPHVGEGGIDVTTGNNFSTDANRQVKNSGDFTHVERAKENISHLLTSLEGIAKNFGGTLPPEVSVRFGHATHATPEQIARMKALGVIVEVNLTSNQATGSLPGEKPAPGQKDAERLKRTASTGDDRSGTAMLEQHALGSMVFHDIDVMLSTDGHDVMDTHLAKEYAKAKQVLEDIHDNLLDVRITVEQARAMNQAGGKVVIPADAQPNDIVSIKYVEMSKAKQDLFDRAYLKFFQTASRYTANNPSPTP